MRDGAEQKNHFEFLIGIKSQKEGLPCILNTARESKSN